MNAFEELIKILEQGSSLGLNLKDQISKIKQAMKSNETIRIVLLGSFSDGKTSVVAGMLGEVLDNMKIDIDESSDELTFYRTNFLGKGFEIVDTPGLFGTKEKEQTDGSMERFSDITKKYISGAHIVLYVCDAVVPLKDSHVPVLETVLLKFHKLDSTIFVINKMDTTGVRMKDPEDYNRMSEIKKETLKGRMKYALGLGDEECDRLNIVCVAADPKGKGLEHWFAKMEDYKLRSHIDAAAEMVKNVATSANKENLMNDANKAVAKDVSLQLCREIDHQVKPLTKVVANAKKGLEELKDEYNHLKRELQLHRSEAKERILDIKSRFETQIDAADLKTIGAVVSNEFGVENDKATGYILLSRVNSVLSECFESNNASLEITGKKMEKFVETQNNLARKALTQGAEWAAKQTITGKMVLAFRDEFLKGVVKFKPWGAVKLAGNITKWMGRISGILTVGFILYDIWKAIDNDKKLQEAKEGLRSALNECITNVLGMLDNDEQYYTNFAPSYNELYKQYQDQEHLCDENLKILNGFNHYSTTLHDWLRTVEIEDVDFEEIDEDVDF